MFKKLISVSTLLLLLNACSTVVTRQNRYSIQKDKIYKSIDGFQLMGDLYEPATPGLKPAVLVVHGGGWNSRSGEMSKICDDLAGSGYVVFNITYRLAPVSLYPKAVEDVADALQYLHVHAAEFQIDPKRIGGWGYSAGANLILLVGLDPKKEMKALVAGGTPADLLAWPDSPIVNKFIGHTSYERPDLWKAASPTEQVQKGSPPLYLYHGKWDHLVEVEQMEKMKRAAEAKDVVVETHAVNGMGHIATYLFSQESVKKGVEFLKAHL